MQPKSRRILSRIPIIDYYFILRLSTIANARIATRSDMIAKSGSVTKSPGQKPSDKKSLDINPHNTPSKLIPTINPHEKLFG